MRKFEQKSMEIIYDSSKLTALRDKLISLKKNYYPRAVRNTLYLLAMDMRQSNGSIEKSAYSNFRHKRSNTFMRSMVWAEYPKGNDIDNMVSGAGIGVNSQKVDRVSKRMEQQEHGGALPRGYKPTNKARGGDIEGNIRGVNRHSKADYRNVENDLVSKSGNELQKELYKAAKGKEYVRVQGRKGGKRIVIAKMTGTSTTYRAIGKTKSGKPKRGEVVGFRYNMKIIYSYNEGKKVTLKPTHFVAEAGQRTMRKVDGFFVKSAGEQLEKAFNSK